MLLSYLYVPAVTLNALISFNSTLGFKVTINSKIIIYMFMLVVAVT